MNDFLFSNRLFLILLSGHLIGDFIFQTDAVYAVKCKDYRGVLLHSLIVSIISSVMAAVFGRNILLGIWIFLATLITHFMIDMAKLKIKAKNALIFIADQVLHVAAAALLAYMLNAQAQPSHSIQRYLFFICFAIVSTVAIKYFNITVYRTFNVRINETRLYEAGAFAERTAIFFLAYMHSFYFLIIPIVIIPRMLYSLKVRREYILYDIASSMILSAFMGIMLRKVTLHEPFSLQVLLILILAFTGLNALTSLSDVILSRFQSIDI